jgi:hypothetical protein
LGLDWLRLGLVGDWIDCDKIDWDWIIDWSKIDWDRLLRYRTIVSWLAVRLFSRTRSFGTRPRGTQLAGTGFDRTGLTGTETMQKGTDLCSTCWDSLDRIDRDRNYPGQD